MLQLDAAQLAEHHYGVFGGVDRVVDRPDTLADRMHAPAITLGTSGSGTWHPAAGGACPPIVWSQGSSDNQFPEPAGVGTEMPGTQPMSSSTPRVRLLVTYDEDGGKVDLHGHRVDASPTSRSTG